MAKTDLHMGHERRTSLIRGPSDLVLKDQRSYRGITAQEAPCGSYSRAWASPQALRWGLF